MNFQKRKTNSTFISEVNSGIEVLHLCEYTTKLPIVVQPSLDLLQSKFGIFGLGSVQVILADETKTASNLASLSFSFHSRLR